MVLQYLIGGLKNIVMIRIISILFSLFLLSGFETVAQCTEFATNNCATKLKGYKHDGKVNSTTIEAGNETELLQRVKAGKNYRIVIGNKENLQNIAIDILDIKRNSRQSKVSSDQVVTLDYVSEKTEMLRIKVHIPESSNTGKSGCIVVLIGEK